MRIEHLRLHVPAWVVDQIREVEHLKTTCEIIMNSVNQSDAFALKDMTNVKIIVHLERHEDGELAREGFAHGLLSSDMIISIYNIMKISPIKRHQIMIISLRMELQDISAKGRSPKA